MSWILKEKDGLDTQRSMEIEDLCSLCSMRILNNIWEGRYGLKLGAILSPHSGERRRKKVSEAPGKSGAVEKLKKDEVIALDLSGTISHTQ